MKMKKVIYTAGLAAVLLLTGCGNGSSANTESSNDKTSDVEECTAADKAYSLGYDSTGPHSAEDKDRRMWALGTTKGYCETECSMNIGNQIWKIDLQSCYSQCYAGAEDSVNGQKPATKLCK
jgi:hypothetical protein